MTLYLVFLDNCNLLWYVLKTKTINSRNSGYKTLHPSKTPDFTIYTLCCIDVSPIPWRVGKTNYKKDAMSFNFIPYAGVFFNQVRSHIKVNKLNSNNPSQKRRYLSFH